MQSLRQCLHMLLWLDEFEPLDPARCWSECVRRDSRAMTGDHRVKWRLAGVGLDDFREQIQVWFSPFRSGDALLCHSLAATC
jgi:hypothetical protein